MVFPLFFLAAGATYSADSSRKVCAHRTIFVRIYIYIFVRGSLRLFPQPSGKAFEPAHTNAYTFFFFLSFREYGLTYTYASTRPPYIIMYSRRHRRLYSGCSFFPSLFLHTRFRLVSFFQFIHARWHQPRVLDLSGSTQTARVISRFDNTYAIASHCAPKGNRARVGLNKNTTGSA